MKSLFAMALAAAAFAAEPTVRPSWSARAAVSALMKQIPPRWRSAGRSPSPSRASEWGIARDRIGILGFSAGGYVAAAVALQHDAGSRPNFAAPIYPATPEDVTPPANAPPLFLVHADDDRTLPPIDHTVRLYAAWKKARLPVELHIYSRGGHGFGMRKLDLPSHTWTDRFRDWLKVQGLLKPFR